MLNRLKASRPFQVIAAYGASQAGNYASGLAFRAFLAMFPLILGMLSIVGLVIHDQATQTKLYDGVVSVFPRESHDAIAGALTGVKDHAGILGVVSIVGLLWSGTSLFAAMEFALTKIFGTEQRDTLRQRLMGLVMVVVFIAAVLLSVTANSAAAASPGAGVLGAVLGAVVLIALMALIYRWVPNRTFALKDIWPGALLAGALIEVFSLVFPLYAKLSKGFGTYGQNFALFFLLATWLSFMSQFILVGAVFNKLRLGVPQDEGIVAASPAEGRESKDPADAIEDEKRETQGSAIKGSGRQARTEDHEGNRVADGAAPAHRSPGEARIAVGAGVAVAALGAALSRKRKR